MPESSGQSNSSGGGVASSAISPIASILTTWMSNEYQQTNVDNTIKANKDLAEYAYSKDLEMWNRQNEYNTPEMQMARYQKAGLNPNLIYGQGNSGNATQMPKYQAPTVKYDYIPPVDFQSMLQLFQDVAMKQAQTDNVKAQTDAIEQKTLNEAVQNQLLTKGVDLKALELSKLKSESHYFDENARHRAAILHQQQIANVLNQSVLSNKSWLMGEQAEGQKLENQKKAQDIVYNKFRNEWMAMGVTSSDNMLVRMLVRAIEGTDLFKDLFKSKP